MTRHLLAEPGHRNLRKRALMSTWLACPPLIIVFDSGAPGVVVPPGKGNSPDLTLSIETVKLLDLDHFKVDVVFNGEEDLCELTVPFSAISSISSGPLEETHMWNIDTELAETREKMRQGREKSGAIH